MTTGKGLRLAVRVRRRSQAYLPGVRQPIAPDIGAGVVDRPRLFVKELPAASFLPPAFSGSWKLEAGSFQLNILQTVVSSFPLNTQLLRALFCWEKRIMVKPHG